jgi:hypothetical protein
MKYVYKCLYMLLDVYDALQDRIGRVLGQNCKICTTDPKKLAISELFANSKIPQAAQVANSDILCPSQHAFGLLAQCRAGGAFRSFSFIVLQLYNPKITSRQCT